MSFAAKSADGDRAPRLSDLIAATQPTYPSGAGMGVLNSADARHRHIGDGRCRNTTSWREDSQIAVPPSRARRSREDLAAQDALGDLARKIEWEYRTCHAVFGFHGVVGGVDLSPRATRIGP